ncbi:gustatory receptor for bitter taste 66a [Bradysia coprophila]|uniref:gustatory receptor for bitter taste 66a n=1 Tax=Bradysia coprophila TaxID=38358 RepID=UPI00187D9168|nr:gustatory receptor for bitter taste 66a [Bradysia coprophila]
MAIEKQRLQLKSALSFLLYFTIIFGVVPFSGVAYYKHKILKLSIFGNIYALVNVAHNVLEHHLSSTRFILSDKQETGTLTNIIGLVIMYLEPVMYSIDVIGLLFNQKKIIACIDQMHKIDEKLLKENIEFDYFRLKRVTIILVAVITILEFSLVTYNLLLFQEFRLDSLYWICTGIPIFLSTISKVWYVALVYNVKQKFAAINDHFENTRKFFDLSKKEKVIASLLKSTNERDDDDNDLPGYLHKEILARPMKRNRKIHRVDEISISGRVENDLTGNPIIRMTNQFQIDDKMDKKLTNLCQLHDEICEIGKTINSMFSFQMLILMANGFMNLTAQFFFVYCGRVDQNIPVLFRSAESLLISIIFIVYTASKCVFIIFISWKTKIDAQKTGVQIHKLANAIDEDHCYQVVNHLSLKLLNHSLNFTACGFFDLDMTTLYAITGAITSYLIILIQFNLASNRKKPTGFNETMSNSTQT